MVAQNLPRETRVLSRRRRSMGGSISGLQGANDPEEPVGVALELEERPSTPPKQRDAAAAEVDVESPKRRGHASWQGRGPCDAADWW